MTVTLVGSRAMKIWFKDAREPGGDWDWFSAIQPFYLFKTFLGEKQDIIYDKRLAQWPWKDSLASPNELYTIKVSHGCWEIDHRPANWDKHARDIVFLSRKGCQLIRPLYEILLPIWKDRYDKSKVSLNKSSGEFFADAVNRKYDHDSVHRSVAYGDRPLYELILKDGSEVAVDNAKFDALDPEDKFRLVREEVYATALERILIPGDYKGSPSAAYHWALRRTATSLFKGEWALFVLLNLDTLRKPDCDYVRRHLDNKDKLILNGEGK